MEKHINVVAALQIGLSIFGIVIGIIILVVLSLVGGFVDDNDASFIIHLVGGIVSFVLILLSIPGIIAGIGLFRKKEWARILTLILSVMNLMNIPVGTAVGAYSIWALVQEETVAIFKPGGKKE
jgi:O-antigen/teichoic acid export membrane protein